MRRLTSLVTGGAGFIGSHVAKHLHKAGHRVVVLDDLSGGFVENIPYGVDDFVGSVTDKETVAALFDRYQFDYIFHLAAYAAEGLSHFIRHFNYTNNLIGSVNLINAAVNAKTVKRFVFTSSIAAYGHSDVLPMTEAMTPNPVDPYGIAKYAVELDLRAAHEMFGLEYTIFRPHNVYGPGQNIADKYRNVIGIFMNQLLAGVPMTIFGDGQQTRAFSYIDDVAPIIADCINVPEAANDVFNIGSDDSYTVLQLAVLTAAAMGREPNIIHLEKRNEVVDAWCSHEKLASVFGAQKHTELVEGLCAMADWVEGKDPKRSKNFDNIEIEMNLPASWR